MLKRLTLITVLVLTIQAQEPTDSLYATEDTAAHSIPAPDRIAQDRINRIRSSTGRNAPEADMPPAFPLTLDDAIRKLIEHNKEVRKARLEYLAGEMRFLAAIGVFEPSLNWTHNYSEAERPDALLYELRQSNKSGIEGILPTSTRYNVSFSQQDIRFPQSTLEWPMVSSGVTITQPLLKDFLGNGPLSDIKIAKAERQIAYNRYRSTLMAQCYNLETTYWKLVYLQEKRRNAEKSVTVARQIVDDSRTLVASGVISKLDAIEVSSQLAQRQMVLSKVKLENTNAMSELMQMIGFSLDSALLSPTAITPLQVVVRDNMPDSLSPKAIDSIVSVVQPELLAAEYTKTRSSVAVSQLKGKALPELNLTGNVGVFTANRNYNLAEEQFFNGGIYKNNWSCGIEFKVPLGTAVRDRYLLKAEKFSQKIAETEAKYIRNELVVQSTLTIDRIRDLVENIANATVVVDYRTSLLQSELVRLRAGLSNVRKIFEMERDLAEARESELELRAQYYMTLSLVDRLLGKTLGKRGLETIVNGKPVLIKALVRE
jgi:outer membrane protein TolC